MAKEHVNIIDSPIQVQDALQRAFDLIMKGLPGGAVALVVRRYEEPRSVEQNSKQWPMYQDLSDQLEWFGDKLTPEHWKELLSNEWQAQKIVPGISGGFCALGVRTSKMKKVEMSELIEIVYAFGASKGVVWSEPSISVYNDYKEAQQ